MFSIKDELAHSTETYPQFQTYYFGIYIVGLKLSRCFIQISQHLTTSIKISPPITFVRFIWYLITERDGIKTNGIKLLIRGEYEFDGLLLLKILIHIITPISFNI
jgi:hypothetical protein